MEEFELAVSVAGSLGVRAIRDGRTVSVVVSTVTPEQRLQEGTRRLENQTDAGIDRRTGIVSLAVEMPSPELAAAVDMQVALVNDGPVTIFIES